MSEKQRRGVSLKGKAAQLTYELLCVRAHILVAAKQVRERVVGHEHRFDGDHEAPKFGP